MVGMYVSRCTSTGGKDTIMTPNQEHKREQARREFYRIVKERLDARIERGETYTTTRDLYSGYEPLHAQGFGSTVAPSQSVAQVLNYSEYRERLYYARHVVSTKAERDGHDRAAPYRIYLRADAPTPKDHVLVPMDARGRAIGEAIASARGLTDPSLHVTHTHTHAPEPQEPEIPCEHAIPDLEALAQRLTDVVRAQASIISDMLSVLPFDGRHSKTPALR